MRPSLAAALASALVAGSTDHVVAAEPAPPAAPAPGEMSDIPVEDWIAMARGRTLSYAVDGEVWALERYDPVSNQVALRLSDGTCLEGVWDYSDPHYCFHWRPTGSVCFRHVRLDDRILVLETQDGVETGAVQTMTGVSDAPVSCGPAPIS